MRSRVLLAAAIVALSLMTVHLQVFPLGFDFIDAGTQIRRHREVLRGQALGHWQYRMLSEWAVRPVILACRQLGIERPVAVGFIAFRILQNLAIFSLAAVYYRKLGLGRSAVLLGLSAVAWGMTNARYDSDLSLNTYSDVIFYLAAALLILAGRLVWLAPLVVAAALNRETSGLVPMMLLASGIGARRPGERISPRLVAWSLTLLACFALTYLGVRFMLGPRPEFPGFPGRQRGVEVLLENLGRKWTWSQLLATFGLLPVVAAGAYRCWPPVLRAFFWSVVPAWVVVHFLASVVAETRLFLVPLVLVIVPGALLAFREVPP
jgi:hypothetical protein